MIKSGGGIASCELQSLDEKVAGHAEECQGSTRVQSSEDSSGAKEPCVASSELTETG